MKPNQDRPAVSLDRRAFLRGSASVGASALMAPAVLRALNQNDRIVVGVIGLGRGLAHVRASLEIGGVDVAYVCDVDRERIGGALAEVQKRQTATCTGVQDFRRILDDSGVHAVTIATCNHWHSPATVLACKSGKHVYVEKPGSHNPHEGALMVRVARAHDRRVQMGNQRRSWPGIMEGIQRLREGAIGPVRYARCWYTNQRPSIGRGKPVPVPEHLDFKLWQGPAPARPYVSNLVHYNWHWRWHWGNGELGNNGVHSLDLARWGLGVDYPVRVTYNGGRYRYQDDQETPDTGTAVFDFGDRGASWEQSSCHPRKPGEFNITTFYGDGGKLVLTGSGYRIYDLQGKQTAAGDGKGGDLVHFQNFFAGLRENAALNSEIEEGQKSALLCHLGNIAYRTGHTVHFDPQKRCIVNDPEAEALWTREYSPGWEPAG